MFYEGDLQGGIALALQEAKAVLCFVHGPSQKSKEWEEILVNDREINQKVVRNAVALRLKVVSRETAFLSSFCPLKSTPAIVVIRNGTLQLNLQSAEVETDQVKDKLTSLFKDRAGNTTTHGLSAVPDSAPSQPTTSAPSASVVDNSQTGSRGPADQRPPPARNSPRQPPIIENPPASQPSAPRESARERTAPTTARVTVPQNAPASTQPLPANNLTESQQSQRADYIRMQREREQKQRDERDRIKQQIKSDREERRHLEQMRKQPETAAAATATSNSSTANPVKSANDKIRVQVRLFDGRTQRQTFPPTATIAADIRPWIDETSSSSSAPLSPYNLKLILTPSSNRTIEAAEEGNPLPELGVAGSCTLVMVPVRGYVDSYAATSKVPGFGWMGSAVFVGISTAVSVAGAVVGGARSILGYGAPAPENATGAAEGSRQPPSSSSPDDDRANQDGNSDDVPKLKMRTLADQREEEARKRKGKNKADHQLYNGNQLNFEPRRDEGEGDED